MNREIVRTINSYVLNAAIYSGWVLVLPFIITFFAATLTLAILMFVWDKTISLLPIKTETKKRFTLRKF